MVGKGGEAGGYPHTRQFSLQSQGADPPLPTEVVEWLRLTEIMSIVHTVSKW